jgi:hypothetical protein
MWKAILQTVKATFPLIAGCIISTFYTQSIHAQQNIIANKDNTRPETNRQVNSPAIVTAFSAKKFNGYNEINWQSVSEQSTRKYIVEYSYDGLDFQSAGQVLSTNGTYNLKHYTLDTRPLVYRIRMEELSGKTYYSSLFFLDGISVSPVQVYPTIVTGNVINVNAGVPLERVIVLSPDGQQLFAKELNGARDFIQIALPSLNKGMYFISFYGNGWRTTTKFMIG